MTVSSSLILITKQVNTSQLWVTSSKTLLLRAKPRLLNPGHEIVSIKVRSLSTTTKVPPTCFFTSWSSWYPEVSPQSFKPWNKLGIDPTSNYQPSPSKEKKRGRERGRKGFSVATKSKPKSKGHRNKPLVSLDPTAAGKTKNTPIRDTINSKDAQDVHSVRTYTEPTQIGTGAVCVSGLTNNHHLWSKTQYRPILFAITKQLRQHRNGTAF